MGEEPLYVKYGRPSKDVLKESSRAVASAVILPEDTTERPLSTSPTLKRRQPSFSDERSKRLRLDNGQSNDSGNSAASPPTAALDRASDRRKSGQLEERKRGQRLFGALLGTLSQSSSSTAQKRRTDIEKKQQAKLKLQAEEQDEKKKQKREALMIIRRREQVKYDKQSMQIRHSNMLAQAHFLHTTTEPKLYYKPWELLPGDNEKIKAQIKEVEAVIEKEADQWDDDHPIVESASTPKTKPEPSETKDAAEEQTDTVGSATNAEQSLTPIKPDDTNVNAPAMPNEVRNDTEPPEASKDPGDDGGEEVVEGGEEDTVIY